MSVLSSATRATTKTNAPRTSSAATDSASSRRRHAFLPRRNLARRAPNSTSQTILRTTASTAQPWSVLDKTYWYLNVRILGGAALREAVRQTCALSSARVRRLPPTLATVRLRSKSKQGKNSRLKMQTPTHSSKDYAVSSSLDQGCQSRTI